MANFVSNDNATSLINAINSKKDTKPVEITYAEWIVLTDEERAGTHYLITDVPEQSGGGHVIENTSGTDMPQEDNLQFVGVYTEDDSTNNRTKVNIVRDMTKTEFNALSSAEKEGFIHITDEPDNPYNMLAADVITYDNTDSGLSATEVQGAIDEVIQSVENGFKNIEIIIPPTITNYASYKNAGGNRGEDVTKYWKDGSLADRIDGVNGFKPFEDLYLWDYIDLDSDITAPSSGGGSMAGTKRIHIGEFNGLNNYQLNKRADNTNFFNHLRMVTGTHFGMSKMNDTNTTANGYLGSKMHTDIIGDISTSGTLAKQLYDQLGSLLIPTTELLTNSINASGYNRFGANSGCSNNWTWADVYARLLSEIESNGSIVWSSSGYDTGNAQHQLPAFKNDKSVAYPQGIYYWLKDVATSTYFCYSSGYNGRVNYDNASSVRYVRLLLTIGRKPS